MQWRSQPYRLQSLPVYTHCHSFGGTPVYVQTLGGPPVYVQTPGPTCKVEAVHAQDAISVCPFYSSRCDKGSYCAPLLLLRVSDVCVWTLEGESVCQRLGSTEESRLCSWTDGLRTLWCRADIVPSRYVNPTWAAYPPEPQKLAELYELVRRRTARVRDIQIGHVPISALACRWQLLETVHTGPTSVAVHTIATTDVNAH